MTFVVPERERWALPPLLRERAAELGERPFLSFGVDDATATYAEIDERTDRLAAGLAALGVRRGEGVLLMLGNRLEFVLSWFALSKLGAPHVPVNVDYRGEFLEHLANTAQARVMVLEDRFLETVAASLPRLPQLRTLIVVGAAPPSLPGVDVRAFADVPLDAEPPAEEIGPADIGSIMFTSGTTGRSKGALMPHASLHLLCERNGELLGMGRDSVYGSELPLFHINAQMTVYGALISGARARLEERFSASRWLERIRASGTTHTSMLGVMLEFVLAQPPSEDDRDHALRSVWTVPCVPQTVERFRERFGIERLVTSYGTTEVGMVANRVVEPGAPASAGAVGPRLLRGGGGRPGDRRARPRRRGRRDPRAPAAPLDDDARLLRNARAHRARDAQPLVPHRRPGALRRARRTCASSTGSRTASGAAARTWPRRTSSRC